MAKNPFDKIKREQDNLVINVNDDGELEIPITSLARELIGQNGADGKDGKDGVDGKDGRGVKRAFITKDRSLAVEYTDGKKVAIGKVLHGKDGADGKPGADGRDGQQGKAGEDGKDGISIVGADIDDGHLFLTFSDGTEKDVGNVLGASGGHNPLFTSNGKGGGAARGIKNNASATDEAIIRFDGNTGLASQNSNVTISDTGAITVAQQFTFPVVDGTAGQVLQTDGSGNLTWVDMEATPAPDPDNRITEDGNNRTTEDDNNRTTE